MRFYLNAPLVIGYVLMATIACLGMLQFAAARNGYHGLSLFATARKEGTRIGIGLTLGAMLGYVLLAPETLTPGPAGTEVAEMFAACALFVLIITLVGAGWRLRRSNEWRPTTGEVLLLGSLPARLHRPASLSGERPKRSKGAPAVVLLPDPTGFAVASTKLVEALCRTGIAVVTLDARSVMTADAPLTRPTLLGHLSLALVELAQVSDMDTERIGLLGFGLGGDAVLHAAIGHQIKAAAAMAVSPVGLISSDPKRDLPGLQWLRELSYGQAWRWQRQKAAFERAALDLQVVEPLHKPPSIPVVVLISQATRLTTRIPSDVVRVEAPCDRRFTLMHDDRACELAVSWFQEQLGSVKKTLRTTNPSKRNRSKHVT